MIIGILLLIYRIPYPAIFGSITSILSLLIDLLLLFLFIRSLHIYNKYFCRLDNDIYINEMQHEQLIIITRYSVFIMSFLMDTIINIHCNLILNYVIYRYESASIYSWAQILYEFGCELNILAYIIAIYYSYEFSYY